MKRKQKQTLRDKSIAELRKLIAKEKGSLEQDVLKFAEAKDKNGLKKKRQAIARMLTYIHEKELEEVIQNG